MLIADGSMKLGEKIKYLREVEGSLRGINRAMSQQELTRAIAAETGSKLSQSYLSQIESGARPHLTNTTRLILASFFKVHPGYLVDDPEGYHPELMSEVRGLEDKLDVWLVSGAERFRRDPELKSALLAVAQHERTRECLLLLGSILETPGLMARLTEVLRKQGTAPPTNTNRSLGSPARTGNREQGVTSNYSGTRKVREVNESREKKKTRSR
jgi:transcriptional regulator with XRE-family HTH domain